ncbi:MAG: tetratricopeptide repeat protein [Candidatus Omnitrophica bacterium]|nr:tetratricopeptide repeat protein [Candidatus Omnitrophota bacterium]
MFCYEAFILWPLAAVLISFIDDFTGAQIKSGFKKSSAFIVITTYLVYVAVFFATRMIGTYADSWDKAGELILELCSIKQILATFCAVSFNILYNSIFTNVFPMARLPLAFDAVSSNCKLGGFILNHAPTMLIMQVAAVVVTFFIIEGTIYLARYRGKDVVKKFAVLVFLLASFTFTLFHFKYYSNKIYHYNFQQFRYQYVPNALVIIIGALFINQLRTAGGKKAIYLAVVALTVANIACILPAIAVEKEQMAPLNNMITNIKKKLESGEINKNEKVYIDKKLILLLPRICWNAEIGDNQMKGTFRWIFDKTQIQSFSDTDKDAVWIIDGVTFEVIKKESLDSFKQSGRGGAQINQWLAEAPQDMNYLEAGYFYKDRGEREKAQQIFEKAVSLGAKNATLYVTLGSIYNQQKKYKEAEILFKKALKLHPNEILAVRGLGDCYLEQNRWGDAARMHKKALCLDPDNIDIINSLIRSCNMSGKNKEAEKILNKALAKSPDDAGIYQELGRYYAEQKEYGKAEKMYKQAIALTPTNAIGYIDLGNFYYKQKRYTQAKSAFGKVLELDPQSPDAYRGLGLFYEINGDDDQAEYFYRKELLLEPKNAGIMATLGNIYKKQKKYKEAEEIFQKALVLDTDNAGALHGLGWCNYFKKRYNAAERLFKEAIAIDVNNAEMLADLGHLYNEQQRYKEAKLVFKQALAIEGNNPSALTGLNICIRNQKEEAR